MKEKYRKEVERLLSAGMKTPAEIVRSAQSDRNPLHDRFEWDNAKCGEQYRIWQARQLLIEYEITIEGKTVRGAQTFEIDRVNGGGYRDINRVRKNPDMVAQWQDEARDAAEQFASRFLIRFGPLKSRMPELFAAIDRIAQVTAKQKKTA